jgi:hypothetical protein
MKAEFKFYDFDLHDALEKEFFDDSDYINWKNARLLDEDIRRVCDKKGHARKNFLNRQLKRVWRGVNFQYNQEELYRKYRVLKYIALVKADGRKMRNSFYKNRLIMQTDFAINMGFDFVLDNSQGHKLPILKIERF